MMRVASYNDHVITTTTKLQRPPLHDKVMLRSPSSAWLIGWHSPEALLWTRCQSIFVAVVLLFLVLLLESVCLSFVINLFLFFHLHTGWQRWQRWWMMVRRRHRLVGTGATAAGECTDTLYHCVDIGVSLTSEDWCVWSVVQFLNSLSTLPETGYSHCRVIECQRKLHPQLRCAKVALVTITCTYTTRGTN